MAAQHLEHPDGSPAGLLAAVRDNHMALTDREVREFAMTAEWADLHPVESIWDAATVEGTEGELAIAGAGAPLVAEFCVAELACALGSLRRPPGAGWVRRWSAGTGCRGCGRGRWPGRCRCGRPAGSPRPP